MKVAVVGATGVIGTSAVRSLLAADHDVVALARTAKGETSLTSLGAVTVRGDVFDHESLLRLLEGCDVVVNAATRVPVGFKAARSSAWRENDRLRTEGVQRVTAAAREARVRRLVQESGSLVYADQGEAWIDEGSPLGINSATEPMAVAESHVQDYQTDLRQGVVLRFGTIIGDDPMTRWRLRGARRGRPVGLGSPDGWVHPLHTDDVGSAVVAALNAPGGVYNVGAEPVRRSELVQGYADAVQRDSAGFLGPMLRRLSGRRSEPSTRSLRVSSEHFRLTTGWTPSRAHFDVSWLKTSGTDTRVVG